MPSFIMYCIMTKFEDEGNVSLLRFLMKQRRVVLMVSQILELCRQALDYLNTRTVGMVLLCKLKVFPFLLYCQIYICLTHIFTTCLESLLSFLPAIVLPSLFCFTIK